jgi:dienelactone hydrolase
MEGRRMNRTVALFHSVLGARAGIGEAADRLRDAGHDVIVVDQYEGRTFHDYDEANRFVEEIGFPTLMQRALDAVAQLDDGFAVMGFSNGGGMATYVALNRRVSRVALCSGALPLDRIGTKNWPAGVPAQLHYAIDDPFKTAGSVESVMESVNRAGAAAEYIQYPTSGHLFTDRSLPQEFDEQSAAVMWDHVTRFLSW